MDEKKVKAIFDRYRSMFAYHNEHDGTYSRVQIAGVYEDKIIIGYPDERGLIVSFTKKVLFDGRDGGLPKCKSYNFANVDDLEFVDIHAKDV